jgi:hypothetical protein
VVIRTKEKLTKILINVLFVARIDILLEVVIFKYVSLKDRPMPLKSHL